MEPTTGSRRLQVSDVGDDQEHMSPMTFIILVVLTILLCYIVSPTLACAESLCVIIMLAAAIFSCF
jgi:heme/copper-type cytochrome/quinol oxidase subunit 4